MKNSKFKVKSKDKVETRNDRLTNKLLTEKENYKVTSIRNKNPGRLRSKLGLRKCMLKKSATSWILRPTESKMSARLSWSSTNRRRKLTSDKRKSVLTGS